MKDRAKAYSKEKHRLAIIGLISSPLMLFLFIILGLPPYIRHISSLVSSNNYINLLAFFALMNLAYYIVRVPMVYYSDFALEHKFSLSNQTFKDWVKKEAKKGIISFIISAPLIFSLYIFIKHWPLHWWLLATILWFFISTVLAKFAPVFIVPLFYKYSPIKNKTLKDKLLKLASGAGFRVKDVYEINISKDTKKANAALMGIGKQKRIVLCDTLIESFNEGEIESVMGHELGHHKLRHLTKLISSEGIFTFITFFITNTLFLRLHTVFGYTRLSDFESLILIYAIMCTLGIFVLPLQNAFSRKLEKDADLFALKTAGDNQAFISTMKKLAEQNLADICPGKFYEIMLYNHPPISRRISFAESFKSIP